MGGGVGVKDVAYFLSSCFDGRELSALAPSYLDFYFRALGNFLASRFDARAIADLEAEWRALYPYACADFQRFLLGWAPAYARDSYALEQTQSVLAELNKGRASSSSES